jgi:hypothetical protein
MILEKEKKTNKIAEFNVEDDFDDILTNLIEYGVVRLKGPINRGLEIFGALQKCVIPNLGCKGDDKTETMIIQILDWYDKQ